MAQTLRDRPGPAGLEVAGAQQREAVLVTFGQVLRGVQPQVLAASKAVVADRVERPVLLLADGVHRGGQVLHDLVAVEDDLVVGADASGYRQRLGRQSPGDRAVHQMPLLLPAQPQQPGRAEHVALLEHVDRQPLEQHGEPGMRLGPRQLDLAHPVLRASHPRRTGVQERQERARVQMPPRPLLGVVIDRQPALAVRAGEPGPARMDHPHVHPTVLDRQLYTSHPPTELPIPADGGVAHTADSAAERPSRPDRTHGKARSASNSKRYGFEDIAPCQHSQGGPTVHVPSFVFGWVQCSGGSF